MADQEKRDKVIEGLEWCMNEKHDCYMEKGCPYENEGDDVGCKYALHRDALALLKAQEPRYTPREVRNALIDYGQHDLDIELGEVIKYDPVKIEDILMKGRRYHG